MCHAVRSLACTILLALSPAVATAAEPALTLEAQLRAVKDPAKDCQDYREGVWTSLGLPPLSQVLGAAAKARAPVNVVRRHYSLSEPAARALLEVGLLRCDRPGRWTEKEDAVRLRSEQELQVLERGVAAAPGHPVMLLAMLTSGAARGVETFEGRFLAALERTEDPPRTALFLAGGGVHLYDWRLRLLSLAVRRTPALLATAVARLGLDSGEDALPFLLEALEQSLGSTPRPEFLPGLAEQTLRALLAAGHAGLAVETFGKLPEDLRAAVQSGALRGQVEQGGHGSGVPPERVPAEDVRVPLAAAFLALGDAAAAKALFEGVPAPAQEEDPSLDSGRGDREDRYRRARRLRDLQPQRVQHQVLSALLRGARPDLFLLTVEIETCRECSDGAWVLLYPKVLGGRYSQTARQQLKGAARLLERSGERAGRPAVKEGRFAQSRAAEAERVQQALAALPVEGSAPAAGDALISGLLAAPDPQVFQEHPLPEGIAPDAAQGREGRRHRGRRADSDVVLPRGFYPVRVEKDGAKVLAIGQSQKLDPTGELSGGGYWLFESTDGGKEWSEPLYTGLREAHPYVVTPHSALPLRRGEVLQIEVQIRELDEASISFPPVALRAKREAAGLFLEAPLAALRRDGDGDGLTDLVEARLLTDPKNPDTDGDGLRDLEDPAPQISQKAPASPVAPVLDAFFADLRSARRPAAVITGVPASKGEDAPGCAPVLSGRRGPVSSDHVLFVVGDRRHFQGARIDARIIVLSPDELKQARARFGPFYPLRLEPPIFDEAGQRLFLRFDESWRGGTFTGERQPDGSWRLKPGSSWVS